MPSPVLTSVLFRPGFVGTFGSRIRNGSIPQTHAVEPAGKGGRTESRVGRNAEADARGGRSPGRGSANHFSASFSGSPSPRGSLSQEQERHEDGTLLSEEVCGMSLRIGWLCHGFCCCSTVVAVQEVG
eukprot:3937563-Rhodomonas_salina.2